MIKRGWTWKYSEREIWNQEVFETREEAINDAKLYARNEGLGEFLIGRARLDSIPMIDADYLLEILEEQYQEEAGMCAGDYILFDKPTGGLEERLNKVFLEWCKENNIKPKTYSLDIEKITVGEDDKQ